MERENEVLETEQQEVVNEVKEEKITLKDANPYNKNKPLDDEEKAFLKGKLSKFNVVEICLPIIPIDRFDDERTSFEKSI